MAGAPMLAVVEGRVEDRLPMEGNPKRPTLIVDKFVSVEPQGCSGPQSTAQLENTYWKLMTLGGESMESPEGAREIHIVLHSEGNRVAGFAGCNQMMGSYTLTGARAHVQPDGRHDDGLRQWHGAGTEVSSAVSARCGLENRGRDPATTRRRWRGARDLRVALLEIARPRRRCNRPGTCRVSTLLPTHDGVLMSRLIAALYVGHPFRARGRRVRPRHPWSSNTSPCCQ